MRPGFSRKLGTAVQILLASILLVFGVDWALFHLRLSHGNAVGTLQVEQYLATPLKNNKAEYDYMGTVDQACSKSLFPQGGNVPCWWLERHRTQWR
jgi:hypothetical protein